MDRRDRWQLQFYGIDGRLLFREDVEAKMSLLRTFDSGSNVFNGTQLCKIASCELPKMTVCCDACYSAAKLVPKELLNDRSDNALRTRETLQTMLYSQNASRNVVAIVNREMAMLLKSLKHARARSDECRP